MAKKKPKPSKQTFEEIIAREVHQVIRERITDGLSTSLPWLVNAVMRKHDRIRGSDKAFYQTLAYDTLTEIVKRCIGKYGVRAKPSDEVAAPELRFEGYTHLQRAYPFERVNPYGGKEIVIVPVIACEDDELLARADEYDAMAKGLVLHAEEIRQFVRERRRSKAA